MTRRKRWLLYGMTFGVFQLAGWLYFLSILSPYPEVDQPPQEVNRQRHPLGFSIIKPGRTKVHVHEHMLAIGVERGRSRYTPVMSVRRLPGAPDVLQLQGEGFRADTFQGRPAFVHVGPSGEYDAWRAVTSRGGIWYEVGLLLPGRQSPARPMPSPNGSSTSTRLRRPSEAAGSASRGTNLFSRVLEWSEQEE
jgi:hypothetical protein